MAGSPTISDAALYTDFNQLSRLRGEAATNSSAATDEVAKQFESLFMQMMLKSMRDASSFGESVESDQTKFYQEMFDKQVALQLVNNNGGIGLAEQLKMELSGVPAGVPGDSETSSAIELVTRQIKSASSLLNQSVTNDPSGELE